MSEKAIMQSERMKKQTIGVEVEMNNITREKAAKIAAELFGTGRYEYTDNRNGYLTWSAWSSDGREWKFQRDTSIPNYARIKELEAKYAEILNSEPTELPAIFSLKTHLIIGGILCLLYLVPGVIYFIIYFKKKKENANWYEKKYAEWSEKMNTEGKRILEEATSLLS